MNASTPSGRAHAGSAMSCSAIFPNSHVEKRLGGRLVTVVVEGEVSAVKAALEAGSAAATSLGEVIATHVIPRPHADVEKLLPSIK